MGKMSERAIVIEDLENLLEDPRVRNAEDIRAVIRALRDLRPDAEIKGMPEVQRCPIIAELIKGI